MVLMLAAVLVVSLLILKGYSSSGLGIHTDEAAAPAQFDPVSKARDAEPMILEAAEAQRKALEQQLQQ